MNWISYLQDKSFDEKLRERLIVEEFSQMHQHMEQIEVAMGQLTNWITTGVVSILGGITVYLLQLLEHAPEKLSYIHCYLFLTPIPLLIFGFAILASHRNDIYRIGYYVTVFMEERIGGAAWGIRSFRFREIKKGESQDPVAYIFWTLFLIAAALFVSSIFLVAKSLPLYEFVLEMPINLIPLAFLFTIMQLQYRSFTADRRPMKDVWLTVKGEQDSKQQ